MFAYLRFRWRLRRLQREYRAVERREDLAFKALEERKAPEEVIADLTETHAWNFLHYENEIQRLHSQYLMDQASRLIVTPPEGNDKAMWDRREGGHIIILSVRGINKLRADIRAEKKGRAELFLMYVPGLVGILGTLIGLASILVSKH